jgi:tetratricopeptide (TPR) repeat protein
MTQKLLFMILILSTLGIVGFITGTLLQAHRRYWKRYLAVFVDKKPPFFRWWLKKYTLPLAIAVGCYIVVASGTLYLDHLRQRPVTANRYAAYIDNKTEAQKQLWKRYVELSAAVEKEPQDVAKQLTLARTLRDLRMGNKALAAYRKVLYLNPQSLEARYELGCLAAAMGDTTLATTQVAELARFWPNKPEQHLLQALIATQAGQNGQAQDQLRAALATDPNNRDARTLLITALQSQRSFGEAARLAEVGVQLDPGNTGLYLLLAKSQLGLGRIAEAQATLRAAADRDAAYPEPLIMLGDLQVTRGEYLPAIKSYEEVLKRAPDHVLAMNNIAQLIADHGYELDRAAQLASRMYAKYPQDPAVADTLGWVLFKQGKLDQALPLLQFAAGNAPINPVHRYHYGAALLKNGEKESGKKELATALKISAQFDGAAKSRELLGNGD